MGVTRGGLQVGGSRRRGGEFKSKAYPTDFVTRRTQTSSAIGGTAQGA